MVVQYEWNDVAIISNDDGFFRECHFFNVNDLHTLNVFFSVSGGFYEISSVERVEQYPHVRLAVDRW